MAVVWPSPLPIHFESGRGISGGFLTAARLTGRSSSIVPTDLGWLTCTLVWMQTDILLIQESLTTTKALGRMGPGVDGA